MWRNTRNWWSCGEWRCWTRSIRSPQWTSRLVSSERVLRDRLFAGWYASGCDFGESAWLVFEYEADWDPGGCDQRAARCADLLVESDQCGMGTAWNETAVGIKGGRWEDRKVHKEMSWANSTGKEMTITSREDYLSSTYNKALQIDQLFTESLLKFLENTRKDLFGTSVIGMVAETKQVFTKIMNLWKEKSEEKELEKEFLDLTKQTGYKGISI